jgi:anti-sigma B factor antagonist
MNAEASSEPLSTTGGAPWSFQVSDADPLVARVGGEIDTLTVPLVLEELTEALAASSGPVRLDISEVTFIDSQGLSGLIEAHRRDPDRPITLAAARPNIRRLLDITGLDQIFTLD